MYSFFLLLSLWLFLSCLLAQRLGRGITKTHLLPLAFVLSSIVQFIVCYLLILHVSSPRLMSSLLISLACVLMAISLLMKTWRQTIQYLFKEFLFPTCQIAAEGNKAIAKYLRNMRIILVIGAMLIMLTTQLVSPTVFNWDSNWYNLSRIPAMIITHSVFPESSPVYWHTIHPITHDLLYLPDITFASLRGMGLISTAEFFVTLGCLYGIASSFLQQSHIEKADIRTQSALLLVTILFLSSDLQVLQSADPKNDLVILMTFVISLSLCLDKELRHHLPFQYILSIMMVAVYAVSTKSYGLIILIPPLVAIFLDIVRIQATSSSPQEILFKVRSYLSDLSSDILTLWRQCKPLLTLASLCILLLVCTHTRHEYSIRHSIHSAKFAEAVAEHINMHGSIVTRMTNFYLNSVRNTTAFLMYPYTTLRKLNAEKPDDYLFGFGPLKHIIYDPRGVLNASTIVRNTKSDAAFGSVFLLPFMIIVSCLMLKRKIQFSWNLYQEYAITLMSCLITFLLFSYTLLGQSFGSKYMGATYIPLIPLLSVSIAYGVDLKARRLKTFMILLSLYSILRLAYLLDISRFPSFFIQLATNSSSLGVTQSPNLFYFQYAGSRYSYSQAGRWLLSLSALPSGQTHVFCFGEQTPSLSPLMYAIQSLNSNHKPIIRLSSNEECNLLNGRMNIPNSSYNFIHLF